MKCISYEELSKDGTRYFKGDNGNILLPNADDPRPGHSHFLWNVPYVEEIQSSLTEYGVEINGS
jgi:hypothetical protein